MSHVCNLRAVTYLVGTGGMVSSEEATPVRFLKNGRCLILESGELMKAGINVIHQQVYWNFTRETAKKIATWLDCKPVFSE
jgi:hypothetical protein